MGIDKFNRIMHRLIVFGPVVYMTVDRWILGVIWFVIGCAAAYSASEE